MQILSAQAITRRNTLILTPLKSMDEVFEQEYRKGEAAGLELAVNFVKSYCENLRNDIAILTKEVESNAESSKISSDGINSGSGRLDLSSEFDADD